MCAEKLKLFAWRGINPWRQKQQGKIIAPHANQARQLLLKQGLQQIKLQRHWQLQQKVSNAEICTLLQQLTTLLQASVPLCQCLQILLQNCVNIALYQWLQSVIQNLETGLSFSQSLQQQGKYLTYQERQLIKVGELTGKLAQVCAQLAQHRQQSLELHRKIQKILLYPSMVLGISVSLSLALLIFVVPQFAQMYSQSQAQLPLFTQLLLWISSALQQHWLALLALLILNYWAWRQLKQRSAKFNQLVRYCRLGLPIFGKILQLSELVGFASSLCLMLQSGVPLQQGLQSFLPQQASWQAPKKQEVSHLSKEIKQILGALQQGYPFSQAVGAFFPHQARQMLQVGEQSGQLATMLQSIAQHYQQQLSHQTDLLAQMLEPVLMLIIGALIGLIMLGLYMPIFNMGALVQ